MANIILHSPFHLLIYLYVQHCICYIITLVLLVCQIAICFLSHLSLLHMTHFQCCVLQSGILSLRLSKICTSPVTFCHHLPTIFGRPSNPLSTFLFHPRFGFCSQIIFATYLLTYSNWVGNKMDISC